jgi:alkylation response protein AidB-like acyl-CoA dehydrogenase
MSNLMSRRDLEFLLYEWLDVEALCRRPRFSDHSRETFDAVMDTCERMAAELFAPHNKTADQNEPRFVDGRVVMIPEVKAALDAYREAGLMAPGQDYRYGGLQLPAVVASAADTWFKAANVGTSAYPLLTQAALNLLVAHGSPEQIAAFAPHMASGRFFGTMALSEPQAGSSLADIRTRAEPRADGTFRLFGSKMWISGGEHELADNIVHFALARIPGGPPGVKGISLFITPKVLVKPDGSLGERNDVVLAGLNHKMGYRGTTNTLLNFGEGGHLPGGVAGAVGLLVGEPHKGLAYMFHMMNEARIGVGLGAVALGYTGYLKSVAYARSRPQGRRLAEKDPASPPVAIIAHADVRRMLLAQKAYVEGGLALNLYCARLVDEANTAEAAEARGRAALLLEVLTPVAKSWPSQWCLEANSLAIQVHGGAGYTRDYDVEQHYRDNRLNPIHEGSHGIQGLDLLGRKVAMQEGAGLRLLAGTLGATTARARAAGGELAAWAGALDASLRRLETVTAKLAAVSDPELRLANSSVYLEAFGHIAVAWIWLEQALAAQGRAGAFYDGKRQAARFFFGWELPRTGPQLDLLERMDDTALAMSEGWF